MKSDEAVLRGSSVCVTVQLSNHTCFSLDDGLKVVIAPGAVSRIV